LGVECRTGKVSNGYRFGANLTRVWRTLMKMNADVETLVAVVRALEAKSSAGVINLNVGISSTRTPSRSASR